MGEAGADVVGVDWRTPMELAIPLVGDKVVQGNLDPNILFAQPAQVEAEAIKVLDSFGAPHVGDGCGPSQIFNLGHGINQHTPPDNVKVLVDAVHSHSKHMRSEAKRIR